MKNYKKAHYFPLVILSLTLLITFTVYAHPGGIDSNGGHYNLSTGEYHYHHGYPAHQHTNGVCPYDHKDDANSDALSRSKPTSETKIMNGSMNYLEQFDFTYIFLLLIPSVLAIIFTFIWRRIEKISQAALYSFIVLISTFFLTYSYDYRYYHYFWIVLIPLGCFVIFYIQYLCTTREKYSAELQKKDMEILKLNDIIKNEDDLFHEDQKYDDWQLERQELQLYINKLEYRLKRIKSQIPFKPMDEFIKAYGAMEQLTPYKIKTDFNPTKFPHFIFRISGNDMHPYICDNDLIIVETDYRPTPGDIILFCKERGKVMCRKLIFINGRYKLFNFDDPYLFYSFPETAFNREQIWVIGKVVGVSNMDYIN